MTALIPAGRTLRILKIANIAPGRNTGMGRVMHETADALIDLGHHVDLMFDPDVPRRGRGTAWDRVGFPCALVEAVRRCMRERGRYDVVEIHEPSAAGYGLARLFGAKDLPPCVLMSHGLEATAWMSLVEQNRRIGRRLSLRNRIATPLTRLTIVRAGLRRAEQIMCLNEGDRQYLLKKQHIPEDRITLVTNGVAADEWSPTDASEWKDDSSHDRPFCLLWAATWLDKKGSNEMTAAFAALAAALPGRVRLSLFGTGYESDTVLLNFPEALRPLVCVVPRFDAQALRAAHASHDVFISAAFYEPWGLALLEAAAAGMAIVTTDADGPRQTLVDGESALFVPRGNPTAITAAVSRLFNDAALRQRLGEAALRRAQEFTWRSAAETHLRAYERAIAIAARALSV